MTTVDITADLNDEDETGFVWTFLDEARPTAVMTPGAIVIAGPPDSSAAEVIDLVAKPAGPSFTSAFSRERWATTSLPFSERDQRPKHQDLTASSERRR